MALAVLLVSGLALAAPKGGDTTTTIYCAAGTSCQGTGGPDIICGTSAADVITPYAGDDEVYGYGGTAEVRHGFGKGTIYGGSGADTLQHRSKHLIHMRSWKDESLLRRPTPEGSPSRPPARHVQ